MKKEPVRKTFVFRDSDYKIIEEFLLAHQDSEHTQASLLIEAINEFKAKKAYKVCLRVIRISYYWL